MEDSTMWKNKDGYWKMTVAGSRKIVHVHKYVWELVNGPVPAGYQLHHGDGKGDFSGEGNKNCNCVANLMLMTRADHTRLHKTGKKHSDATKRKISAAGMGNKYCLGYKASAESRAKMSLARIGHHNSEESKQKLSEAKMGHKVSAETREKLSKANIGKKASDETKRKMSEIKKLYWALKKDKECV
jgi:hypothetical protein